ncbi:hypothetical protein SAMN04488123_1274 [Natribacillus halophilus]|uniref:Uncharacterized protein n=1 Tax=Natribacillus halophilus TaxID=549003 RepID=A0A1G8SEV6_9BACI|nr:hypothetical protein SAMN04488123_1274 [Natribacillus halophilus]
MIAIAVEYRSMKLLSVPLFTTSNNIMVDE